jgi:hypothetical protein
MRILYNFASRSRPNKFFACLDNIHSLARHDNFVIIATLDVDDPTMNTPEVRYRISEYKKVVPYWGFSKSKIDAINKNVCFALEWDILINTSDDFVFLKEGFDKTIIDDFWEGFRSTDGFLHYPDGAVNEKLATMSIIGRPYYDRFGYIYHPDYVSVYCDKEAQEVAKRLCRYKYINNQLFEHRHPVWRKTEWDDQYRKTEDPVIYAKDAETYRNRKANNFDL